MSVIDMQIKDNPPVNGYWFSRNPSRAWAEKFYLAYIPFFFALNGAKQAFGWLDVGTFWHVVQNLVLLLPLFLMPLLIRRETFLERRWYETYWFKALLWMLVFNFVATYFLSEYFFDVLGMVYHFPRVNLYLDSALLGTGQLQVPLGMYFNAPAFFIVYHTLAMLLIRRLTTFPVATALRPLLFVIVVIVVAYAMAWLETRLIATDANSTAFYYRDLEKMLTYGSWFYACYFFASFPMFYRLEEGIDEKWPLSRVVFEALAAGMMAFILVDIATHWLGGSL